MHDLYDILTTPPPYRSTGQAPDRSPGQAPYPTEVMRSRITSLTEPAPYRTQGARYILPCAVLHHGGLYEYVLVSADQARTWVKAGPYVSHVSHPEWAWMLEQILSPLHGLQVPHVPAGTPLPVMDYADDALVFTPDGGDVPGQRWDRDRKHSAALVAQEGYVLGLLKRLG